MGKCSLVLLGVLHTASACLAKLGGGYSSVQELLMQFILLDGHLLPSSKTMDTGDDSDPVFYSLHCAL